MHAELSPPAPHARRWHVLAAIGIGTAMSAVDASIINTVLPLLRRDLGTTVAGVEWVATVYLLTVSALLLAVGRAGDLHGLKRMYLGGFAIFGVGSVLCGLAPSARVLVAMRAIQGAGAELVFALFLYRSFALPVALLAGAGAAVGEWLHDMPIYYPDLDLGGQLAIGAFMLVSGVLIAGLGSWLLVRALARTGVLSAFPSGREQQPEA